MSVDNVGRDDRLLIRRVGQGDRSALARLLTLASNARLAEADIAAIRQLAKPTAPIIALTGSGGVGKSSLLGALAAYYAKRGERVGVLACDPESAVTGGALLGDRCRILGDGDSERIFVRSLSTPFGRQGVAANIETMLAVMKAFGFGRIFVETVGAGQGDVAVRWVAEIVVLVLQPQTGDDLQWEKAGILEVADVVVVNKGDLPGSDRTVAELTQQLRADAGGRATPVVKTSIAKREGIEELCRVLDELAVSPKK